MIKAVLGGVAFLAGIIAAAALMMLGWAWLSGPLELGGDPDREREPRPPLPGCKCDICEEARKKGKV